MKILLLDPFSGAAGDMIVGALLDVGADRSRVEAAMRSVVREPTIERVDRAGIQAVRVKTHAAAHHRTLAEVLDRVSGSAAPDAAREMAKRVFVRMHRAEERIHGGHAHFHEVGADDAVADVVGACTALSSLAVDGVAVLPVALGRGAARSSHGTYPLPAPATVGILQDSDLQAFIGSEEGELCTPTGAALLAEFCTLQASKLPPFSILAVGYGAGSRNPAGTPNVLRAMLVETETPLQGDRIDILETNVDDVTGEVLGYTLSRLMAEGARDASALPALMKKGRSGHLIRVLCAPHDTDRLAEVLAAELGTLGVRCIPSVHRFTARRSIETVRVAIRGREYALDVKCGWLGDRVFSVKAEYEQAQACAGELGLPLRDVAAIAEEAARNLLRERGVLGA
ncbi:MAG: nickel pincer cofactor biosynthesis protein LarC [Methanomicrobiaceae archaeon]|uniref:Nickel insertion protein n=1 Tax=hydrocarbon metagenome TaxID=938273 RepID=A0A0W8FF17_9ZZZZ|nr:nickel pincer cofactor biosynthesis protein LarC [Methanomicrobiaceae archaeon]MDD5419422.1 nickel pincer cofactor biosynthesis protein LarC [Methanomicrobiaceae archaeon]